MVSGIMILFFGCFFLEQSTILKKRLWAEIDIHQISLLVTSATMIFAFLTLILKQDRSFERTLASFFLLIFQVLAGVLFQEVTNQAIHHADRSTFSVMSMISIPLLLISDIVLGYGVSRRQIAGVSVLIFMLWVAIFRGDFSMKGMKYIVCSNLISIGTIIAFKYSTTHYASTEMMNFLNSACMSFLFLIIVSRTKGRKGVKSILKPKYLWFASLYGMGGVLSAMAYKYMIASMVIAFKRFFSMMFGVITGKLYFNEKNLLRKLSIACVVGVGVFVMNLEPLLASYLGNSEKKETHHAVAQVLFPREKEEEEQKSELFCSEEYYRDWKNPSNP